MAKIKCSICSENKGRRNCRIKEGTLICSPCCAGIRNTDCAGCEYYAKTEKWATEKYKKSGIKNFIARIDPDVEERVGQALELVEKKKIREGESRLLELLRKHPDLYIVHYGMGTLLSIKGNHPEAISCFDKCLKIFPYFVEAWFNKGMSHKCIFDMANMLKSFQKVVELGNPEVSFVITAQEILSDARQAIYNDSGLTIERYIQSAEEFERAFTDLSNHRYEKALSGFQRVLKINRNHQQSYGNIGLCHAFLDRKTEAIAAFDRALEIDPDYAPARQNRAAVLALPDGERLLDNIKAVNIEYYKDQLNVSQGK